MANLKTTTIDGALIEKVGTATASQVAGAAGTPAVFATAVSAGATNSRIGICGVGSGKCVIVYGDDGNSDQGTAIVGTVKGDLTGTSITYGTPVVFQSAAGGIEAPSVTRMYDYGASAWRILIAYANNTNKGATIVGTVSGDTITFGTEQIFANHTTIQPKAVAFTQAGSGKVAISYTNGTNNSSYVIVGTLSGTTITYGTPVALPPAAGHGRSNDIAIVQNSPTIVISYRDLSNSNQLTAIAGSVSGTAVTLGTAVVFYATNTTNSPAIANVSYPYNKFVVAWKSSSNVGQACVGTLSGTTISFGTAENFSATAIEGDLAAVWDDDGSVGDGTTEGVIIVYGSGDVDLLRATPVRVTGTNTINIGTTVNGPTCGPSKLGVIYDSHNEKIVSAYVDTAASNYGTAVAWRALPGGNITVDLATGSFFDIDLQDLGTVRPRRIHSLFFNNPHTSQTSSFILKLTQSMYDHYFRWDALQDFVHWPGGSGGREVNGSILLGGIDNAVTILQFTTWDAGTTWHGKIIGETYPEPEFATNTDILFGARGVWAGFSHDSGYETRIDYITIATPGNATVFGDLTAGHNRNVAGTSNGSRGVFPGQSFAVTTIDYITIATTGDATDFGDLTQGRGIISATSDGSRGAFAGGTTGDNAAARVDTIDYITIATTGNATDFGNLTVVAEGKGSASDGSRGLFAAGSTNPGYTLGIDYITIAATGNAADFGDMLETRRLLSGASDGSRGVFGGGGFMGSGRWGDGLEYVTISTRSNSSLFGNLTHTTVNQVAATSNGPRGVWGGGYVTDIIAYITIATTGDALDFGDLTAGGGGSGATSGD